ncbi:50S ribosomal protein L24 [bioreactor metagenome]|uniref:50S ribosomal protein L24 n=1 Tax=bioreactor metagenome TaxID=1076179 RepID=A0A645BRJ5_9ZZZZ
MTAPKMHVKKDDNVVVLKGKDAGKQGKILSSNPTDRKVIVEGVNLIKRHMRPSNTNPKGGIVEKEAPIFAAKVQVVCPSCSKPTRVGRKVIENGKHVRYCKKCGQSLDK